MTAATRNSRKSLNAGKKNLNNGMIIALFHILMITIFSFLVLSLFILNSTEGADEDHDGIPDDDELTLGEKYSPILHFEKGEDFYPVKIEYHLNNSNLNQSRDGDDLIDPTPTPESIGNYTDPDGKYYLDNREGTVDDDNIEKDYKAEREELGFTIYCHVTSDLRKGNNYTIIQYWMFYAFNKGTMNIHEGDWEMVQVVIDPSKKPKDVMYSQHTGGQRTSWSDVEKDGDHIEVYVARGSHANYFRPYQGKLSLANDIVGDDGRVLKPKDYTLVPLGEKGRANHSEEQGWLDFAGRWGDYGTSEDELRGKRGPYGPVYREEGDMWNSPLAWGNDLQSVDSTTFRIAWFFYNFITIFIAIAILSVIIILYKIHRRKKKTGLGKRIFSILYIDGLNLKSIGNVLSIIGIIFAILSLFYGWYGVSVDIDTGSYQTDGTVDVITIDGTDGVQINKLESNAGLVQLFAFPIPFSVIIGFGLFKIVLSSVGMQKSSKLGRKYIFGGIKLLIPVIIILIFVMQLAAILDMTPIDVPEEAEDLIETISGSPFRGDETKDIGDYGTVHLKWGLEKGGIFLMASGILLFVGGFMEILANQEFFQAKKEERKTKEESAKEAQMRDMTPDAITSQKPIPPLSPQDPNSFNPKNSYSQGLSHLEGKGTDITSHLDRKGTDITSHLDGKGTDITSHLEGKGTDITSHLEGKGTDITSHLEGKGTDITSHLDGKNQ